VGRQVLSLMYGAKRRKSDTVLFGDDSVELEEFCREFNGEDPQWCEGSAVLGYLVISDLEDSDVDLPIGINELDKPEFAGASKSMWASFDAYSGGKGVFLDAAQFYLVRTEIR
jgi:hypothetical protein